MRLLMVTFILICTGCASKSSLPVYPEPEVNRPYATLSLINNVTISMMGIDDFLMSVEVDGFSPTIFRNLPEGGSVLRLSPGSHIIKHIQFSNPLVMYNPIISTFNVEAGKIYTIRFEKYRESMTRFGYSIHYDGWTDIEISQWPNKNINVH